MVFSSPIFLFLFLPVVLLGYLLVGTLPNRKTSLFLRNVLLTIVSLYFYAWGEKFYVLVMLLSIGITYFLGRVLATAHAKLWLFLGIVYHLSILGFLKYSGFFVEVLSNLGLSLGSYHPPHLPIGISFFTFQAISYLIDCHRSVTKPQQNPLGVALYISLFPQLIAGPIVRYSQIEKELSDRNHSLALFDYGIKRFVIGLAKKVLIANTIAEFVDYAFALPPSSLSLTVAWLAIIGYALQIYYDFSGYSDMAIGLGAMFGFHFPENFRTPYRAKSLREFWRRWHITLSEWFRDYLYFPLGGSRGSFFETSRNLFLVFILCGLWHGAAWTFVCWGLLHGFFLALERGAFGRMLLKCPASIQHSYLLLVVLLSWVLFRTENLQHAFDFYAALFGANGEVISDPFLFLRLDREVLFTLALGISLAPFSLVPELKTDTESSTHAAVFNPAYSLLTVTILLLASAKLASSSYNPFIYFRF
ncbi:MAG: MBOAT family protein [Bdellovibrionales bacterium]|nr:MBOAT family protein [Bdellovibrionales bacterium]